jgi:hypothetical protein
MPPRRLIMLKCTLIHKSSALAHHPCFKVLDIISQDFGSGLDILTRPYLDAALCDQLGQLPEDLLPGGAQWLFACLRLFLGHVHKAAIQIRITVHLLEACSPYTEQIRTTSCVG